MGKRTKFETSLQLRHIILSYFVDFLISISSETEMKKILKKFRQIENQLGFFHPWIPGPLAKSARAPHVFSERSEQTVAT